MFSDFEDQGEMWVGHGPREVRREIAFSEPFLEPPEVQAGLSMWDIAQVSNQRADLSVASVTEDGFTLVFRTWGDTKVARVRADWIALGPLDDEDQWDV